MNDKIFGMMIIAAYMLISIAFFGIVAYVYLHSNAVKNSLITLLVTAIAATAGTGLLLLPILVVKIVHHEFWLLALALTSYLAFLAAALLRWRYHEPWWRALLPLPSMALTVMFLALLNYPKYRGAMDGFAFPPMTSLFNIALVCVFPTMCATLRLSIRGPRLTGALLIAMSLASFAWGIWYSHGRDGFISDNETSEGFVFLAVVGMLFASGIAHLRQARRSTVLKDH